MGCLQQRPRIRLLGGQCVAANEEVEILAQMEVQQQRLDVFLRLVGDAGHGQTDVGHALEAAGHPRIEARLLAVAVPVVRMEALARVREGVGAFLGGLPGRLQHAQDEAIGPLAHVGAHLVHGARCQPQIDQHAVGRCGQVGDGVQQRAVQVKAQGTHGSQPELHPGWQGG